MKKLAGKLAVALLVSSMITTPVFATPTVNDLRDDKKAAEEAIDDLKEELSEILGKINKMEENLIKKGEEITKATSELEKAIEKEKEQYEAMKLRIKYMYEQGDASLMEALMNSNDFTDFVNKAEYVQNVNDYDREQL